MQNLRISADKQSRIPLDALVVARKLVDAGFEAVLVGGCVRDLLLDRAPKDWDMATSATPDEMRKIGFADQAPEMGTMTLRGIEVTTYRLEGGYADFRRPGQVIFSRNLLDDLQRRDFTINAIALDPFTGALTDPHDGMRDLQNGIVRAVGMASARFNEDALRMLRAVRFATRLEFVLDSQTRIAIQFASQNIAELSKERVADEIGKMLLGTTPDMAISHMHQLGMLRYALPEVAENAGVEQNTHHSFTVMEHLLWALRFMSETLAETDKSEDEKLILLWSALLHDIGKKRSRRFDSEKQDYTFHNHENIGADMADALLRRLKFSTDMREAIVHLVREHMWHVDGCSSPKAVRRFMRRALDGDKFPQGVEWLLLVRRADWWAHKVRTLDTDAMPPYMRGLLTLMEQITLDEQTAFTVRDLAINGHDLMTLGFVPGPQMGAALRALLDLCVEDSSRNTKDTLTTLAVEMLESGVDFVLDKYRESQ